MPTVTEKRENLDTKFSFNSGIFHLSRLLLMTKMKKLVMFFLRSFRTKTMKTFTISYDEL